MYHNGDKGQVLGTYNVRTSATYTIWWTNQIQKHNPEFIMEESTIMPSSPTCSNITTLILDGKGTAVQIRASLSTEIATLSEKNLHPGLAVLLVGTRVDSATYVRLKIKACSEIGMHSNVIKCPESVSTAELLEHINALNADETIHGILVQLPLPDHVNEEEVLCAVLPEKDVDGLHPLNVAKLCIGKKRTETVETDSTHEYFNVPCTPQGCLVLLDTYKIPITGAHVVILGRSAIVGLPLSLLFLQRDATVTICHSLTKNIMEITKTADIIVAAMGCAEKVTSEWIKEGAVILDVGINSITDVDSKRGYRLVGDVQSSVRGRAGALSPVPNGIGPMTIAMLLHNTVESAKRSIQ